MPVDFHVHLEEGPYTFQWLQKTILALDSFAEHNDAVGSKERLIEQVNRLNKRLDQGCYHEKWLRLYLEKAKQLGLKEVGMVDHLYRFHEAQDYFERFLNLDSKDDIGQVQRTWLSHVRTENMDHFVERIEDAKKEWAKHGIHLRLGIEADYFIGGESELKQLLDGHNWDYIIGSIHFVNGWGFDNPETTESFENWDLKELYDTFYASVETMIRSQMFDFVAHLDNLKVFNYTVKDPAFNQEWYERIADALVETNTSTEINAGLSYRYPAKEMCPGPEFLRVLVNRGVSFTLSSDAHYPNDLGKGIFENRDDLKELGIYEVVTFSQRKKVWKRI